MKAELDAPAPNFRLAAADGSEHTLEQYRGKVVVLLFYVGDHLPVCSRELSAYNEAYKRLNGFNDLYKNWDEAEVVFLGVSPNNTPSQYAFSCRLDLKFPLLSDETHDVSKQYGAQVFMGLYRRSTFVIDQQGDICFAHRAGLTGYVKYLPVDDAMSVVDGLLPTRRLEKNRA